MTQLQTLQWQFQLSWRLFAEVYLPTLTDEACLWEPAPDSWTVRLCSDGKWHPDWVVPEPDPAPPVTIAWLSWHMLWWWSGMLAAIHHEKPPNHNEITWPGSAAAVTQRLETLATQWSEELARLCDEDLEKPLAYPWSEPRPLRVALAWTNSELMKNVAEIGILYHIFGATHGTAIVTE
jgi:hypothetical protein